MGEDKMFNRLSISKIGHVPAKGDRSCFFRIPSTLTRQWASVRLVSSPQLGSSSVLPFCVAWCPCVNQNMSVGVIFMCFTIDYRILHVKITPEAIQDATHFYTLFYNAPPAIKVGLRPCPLSACP